VDALPFRDRLTAGARLVGTVVSVPDVGLAELTASAVDFIWIDLEHGALSGRDVQPLAIAAHAAGAACLVRVRGADDATLAPALDAGVDGVVVPRVESAAEAERVANRLRYPPRGSRGLAARRASSYGRHARRAADPVLMAQIESVDGVDLAASIARVDGVDALVAGCADLALDIGENGERGSESLRIAIAHVQRAADAAGIASGVAGPADPELLSQLAGDGSSVLVLGADVRIYARALTDAFCNLHDEATRDASEAEGTHVGT
jgi:2-keto-3-deoxy-L-rhamnonate aldolase RhmA